MYVWQAWIYKPLLQWSFDSRHHAVFCEIKATRFSGGGAQQSLIASLVLPLAPLGPTHRTPTRFSLWRSWKAKVGVGWGSKRVLEKGWRELSHIGRPHFHKTWAFLLLWPGCCGKPPGHHSASLRLGHVLAHLNLPSSYLDMSRTPAESYY